MTKHYTLESGRMVCLDGVPVFQIIRPQTNRRPPVIPLSPSETDAMAHMIVELLNRDAAPNAEYVDDDVTFCRHVAYFWLDKGEIEGRYRHWDAERCKRLMPDFYEHHHLAILYKAAADTIARKYEREDQ